MFKVDQIIRILKKVTIAAGKVTKEFAIGFWNGVKSGENNPISGNSKRKAFTNFSSEDLDELNLDTVSPIDFSISSSQRTRERFSRFHENRRRHELKVDEKLHGMQKQIDTHAMESKIYQAQNDKALAIMKMEMEVGFNNVKQTIEWLMKETKLELDKVYQYIEISGLKTTDLVNQKTSFLLSKIQETQHKIALGDTNTIRKLEHLESKMRLEAAQTDMSNLQRFNDLALQTKESINTLNMQFSNALSSYKIENLKNFQSMELKNKDTRYMMDLLKEKQNTLKEWINGTILNFKQGVNYDISNFSQEVKFMKQIHEKNNEIIYLTMSNMDIRNKNAFLQNQEKINDSLNKLNMKTIEAKYDNSGNDKLQNLVKLRELQDQKRAYENSLQYVNYHDYDRKRELNESIIAIEAEINNLRSIL